MNFSKPFSSVERRKKKCACVLACRVHACVRVRLRSKITAQKPVANCCHFELPPLPVGNNEEVTSPTDPLKQTCWGSLAIASVPVLPRCQRGNDQLTHHRCC